MTEPTFNAAGYPTEETLDAIREWDFRDKTGWFEFVRKAWMYPDYFRQDGNSFKLSTGGWSGNEELIGAMQNNLASWSMCWRVSRRGGHYEFVLPGEGEASDE